MLLLIASALTLAPMIRSDIKEREVNILWLLLFGGVQIYFNSIDNIFINLIIILLMLSGVYLYLIVRYGTKSKITDFIGAGDIVFFFALTAAFPIIEFIYFLIIGFIFSIAFWLLTKNKETVPLVSTLGSIYLIWLLIKTIQYE